MRWGLAVIALANIAIAAKGAEVATPERFYIVSDFFSDYGGFFYYRLIDVEPDGADTVIRYTRIANSNVVCPRKLVQSAEVRLRNKTPGSLVRRSNPCRIKPSDLDATLAKYSSNGSYLETMSFGIVAQCGTASYVLSVPIQESVNFKALRRSRPDIARLWDLSSDVETPAFGKGDIFHNRTEAEDLELQRAGEKVAPDLASGKYDLGLAAAVRGINDGWKSPSFKGLLEDYHGPFNADATGVRAVSPAQLVNPEAYHFSQFVEPKYPPLAAQARIQGKVELRLTVDSATGEVSDVQAVSGNELLQIPAADAAKQWRLKPHSAGGTVDVTLDFTLRCR